MRSGESFGMATTPSMVARVQRRGRGIGRALIEAVYAAARAAGCSRVYWQTQAGNHTGRQLYDKLAEHRGFIVYAHELE